MNCRRVHNILSAYMDGELTGVEQLQVRQHLRVCHACNEEYESLLLTKRLVSGLTTKTPRPNLEQMILLRLTEEEAPRAARWSGRAWWSLLGAGQRQRLRVGALCVGATVVCLWVITPFAPGHQPTNTLLNLQPPPPLSARLRVPLPEDYQDLNRSAQEAQPFNGGPTIAPRGAAGLSDTTVPVGNIR